MRTVLSEAAHAVGQRVDRLRRAGTAVGLVGDLKEWVGNLGFPVTVSRAGGALVVRLDLDLPPAGGEEGWIEGAGAGPAPTGDLGRAVEMMAVQMAAAADAAGVRISEAVSLAVEQVRAAGGDTLVETLMRAAAPDEEAPGGDTVPPPVEAAAVQVSAGTAAGPGDDASCPEPAPEPAPDPAPEPAGCGEGAMAEAGSDPQRPTAPVAMHDLVVAKVRRAVGWSAAEDAAAMAVLGPALAGGATVSVACREVAARVGRSFDAASARYHARWKGQLAKAAPPEVAPAPAPAEATPDAAAPVDCGDGLRRGRWTAEEDLRARALIDAATGEGATLLEAFEVAGRALGRSGNRVKAWFYARMHDPAPVTPAVAGGPALPVSGGPGAAGNRPAVPHGPPRRPRLRPFAAAVPRVVLPPDVPEAGGRRPAVIDSGALERASRDPLGDHLAGVPRDAVWTVERDFRLVEAFAAGGVGRALALDRGLREPEARARIDLLQGFDPATGRRRFARDLVLGGLRRLMRAGAAA